MPQHDRRSSTAPGPWSYVAVGSLFGVPVFHPFLIPWVGVPSHLLWWVHVLPVALITFRGGRAPAAAAFSLSTISVALGESFFGAGYGVPAPGETVWALTVALAGTNLLVVAFGLYARRYSNRFRVLFDRVRMGVVQVDSDDRIEGANPAALHLLGTDDGTSLLGRPVTTLVRVPGLDDLRALEESGPWTGRAILGDDDAVSL